MYRIQHPQQIQQLSPTALTLPLPTSPTTYNVWVAAVGEKTGVGEYSRVLQLNYTAPNAPKDLTIINISCNTITLEWTQQAMSGGLPVTSYEVVISTEGQREQVNNYTIKTTSESTSHRLTLDKGIESNKTYQVQLRLTNHIGGSVNAQRLTITTPPKVKIFNALATSANTVSIVSKVYANATLSYTCTSRAHYSFNISHRGGLYRFRFFTTSSGLNISSLLPDTVYSIQCAPVVPVEDQSQCVSQNTTLLVKTFPWVPSEVTIDSSFYSDHKVHQSIQWSRPHHHSSQLKYIIKYGPAQKVQHPTQPTAQTAISDKTTVIIKLPIPIVPVTYYVWVAALSDIGRGQYSYRRQIHYTKPTHTPTFLRSLNTTCNSITLEWNSPIATGGLPVVNYLVQLTTLGTQDLVYINVTTNNTTLVQLEPNTLYRIYVRAANTIGSSEWSNPLAIKTLKRDAQPIDVLTVTSDKIEFTIIRRWAIQTYQCRILRNTVDVLLVTDGIPFTVSNLRPNTTYNIDCIGAKDRCVEANTTVITRATVPSEPTKVWVEQMFASSALLTWSEPLENGGSDITGYKITFTSDRHGGYYVTGVVKMIKLVGLLANNAYNISISAFNTIGFGRASSQVFHTKSSDIIYHGTSNLTVSVTGTRAECQLSGRAPNGTTWAYSSTIYPGYGRILPLLDRSTEHILNCTNSWSSCQGPDITVKVPSCDYL
jgi:hypothetical protein